MKHGEVMNALEAMGTAQNRKVYARHGVGQKMFGVSYANLEKLRKRTKTDQELAVRLWATGNHDARVLATMVADPAVFESRMIDSWVRDLDSYVLADAFSKLVSRSSVARKKMEAWTKSRQEWVGRAGWQILVELAQGDRELPDAFFESYLQVIETEIHQSRNRARDAMNLALISIGLRSSGLEKTALAAAKRIGKVEVDHGETGCKTPDAADSIRKAKARKRSR
jgi:3-methyladenine DNA glycosylase AlkD